MKPVLGNVLKHVPSLWKISIFTSIFKSGFRNFPPNDIPIKILLELLLLLKFMKCNYESRTGIKIAKFLNPHRFLEVTF